MHSQHRHQLQQNELGQLTMKAVPWFEKHGMQLIAGVVAALILIVGGAIWWNTAATADTAAWTKLSLASTVDEYGDVADRFPGTLAANWAQLRMGELNLESGVRSMFSDRELGLKDLKAARESFDAVVGSKLDLPQNVRERAILGLARVLETTSDGDTGPAIEAYQRLLTEFPNSVYKASAEEKVAELKTGGAREFYSWFQQQKPAPSAFPRPQDGQSAAPSEFDPFALPPAAKPPLPTIVPDENPPAKGDSADPAKDDAAAPAPDSPATPKADSPASETPAADAPAADASKE